MAKLNTLHKSVNPSVMLFGAPFTGKSLLAAKLAEHFNIIYVDMESGHDVAFQLPEEWQQRIEVIELKDTSSYPIAIETVLKMVKGAVDICEKHGKVNCMVCKKNEAPFVHFDPNNVPDDTIVVFDSSTQLTSSALANITRKMPDDYKLEFDDWGSLAKLMDVFFSHIQNANYKRIVTSHVTEAKQDDGRTLLFPIAGSRNFSSNVAKFFDHVIYMEKKNKSHKAASATTYMNNIMTGSRTNVRVEDMEEVSLLSIFKPEAVPEVKAPEKPKPTSSSAKAGTGTSNDRLAALKAKMANR